MLLGAALAACSFAPRPASAFDDVLPARALAMGGASRATATGALGPLFNPAGMTVTRQYSIEAMYGFRVQDLGSTVHLSIADSVTSRVAAGIYYTFVYGTPKFTLGTPNGPGDVVRQGTETGLSLAMALGDWFSFGVTSKYVRISTEVTNPEGMKAVAAGETPPPKTFVVDTSTATAVANGFTMDAGLLVRLGQSFRLGVEGHNLIPLRSFDAPIGMGVGLSYQYATALLVNADVKIDFDKYRQPGSTAADGGHLLGNNRVTGRAGFGLEYVIRNIVPVRLGYAYDSGYGASYLSLGGGYLSSRFGIDLGYRQKVSTGLESTLMLGVRVFLQ